jgi:hypothetical protein
MAENTIETKIDTTIFDDLDKINNNIALLKNFFNIQLSDIQQQLKTVEKKIKKDLKKKKGVNVKKNTNKKPSGFAKPTKVTKELCEFMNRPEGTEIARTEVTKVLTNYIKTNNLQQKGVGEKNKIIPDNKLLNLLGLSNNEVNDLTFFNIQKYMNKHFISNKNVMVSTAI